MMEKGKRVEGDPALTLEGSTEVRGPANQISTRLKLPAAANQAHLDRISNRSAIKKNGPREFFSAQIIEGPSQSKRLKTRPARRSTKEWDSRG
jgi:hypothetical protein